MNWSVAVLFVQEICGCSKKVTSSVYQVSGQVVPAPGMFCLMVYLRFVCVLDQSA
jgi:hypothetical protein